MEQTLQRMNSCVRAYQLHKKGIGLCAIRRQLDVKTDASTRFMINRGALLGGKVVGEFTDRTRVRHLPLSTKLAKALAEMGIKTVRQARVTSDQVYRLHPGMGPGRLQELRKVLAPPK